MLKKVIVILLIIFAVLLALGWVFRDDLERRFLRPTESSVDDASTSQSQLGKIEVSVDNLDTPWGIAFLPSGDYLVTERPGTLKRIGQNGQTYEIEGVQETSEGGLLGVAVHPEFANNNLIYLYLTTENGNELINRVEQFKLEGDAITKTKTLLDNIPGAQFHDGGRMAFGPDGLLYITTGDAGNESSAQDIGSLAGKILRMEADGSVPEDNPFDNYVYSYGHRNPQGIAWDDTGKLWSSEHGPSGLESGNDELNLIEKGGNYGWPVIRGQETAEGMITPVVESGTEETWAPAGLAYADGSLFFTGLRGQTLYQAKINGSDVTLEAHFREEYGRLRAVQPNNGFLYVTTSNRDGRGQPAQNDDKIIKIPLEIFR